MTLFFWWCGVEYPTSVDCKLTKVLASKRYKTRVIFSFSSDYSFKASDDRDIFPTLIRLVLLLDFLSPWMDALHLWLLLRRFQPERRCICRGGDFPYQRVFLFRWILSLVLGRYANRFLFRFVFDYWGRHLILVRIILTCQTDQSESFVS